MKLRYTIRDVFWLVLVVALALGWLLDLRSKREEIAELEPLRKDVVELRGGLKAADEELARLKRLLPPAPKGNDNPFN